MLDLKDIKPVEYIQIDYSMYILASLFIIVFIVLYLYVLKISNKKLTSKQKAAKRLKDIDFRKDNHKNIAYSFTLDGQLCITELNKKQFYSIVKQLEKYKYKQETTNIDEQLIDIMKKYIKEQI